MKAEQLVFWTGYLRVDEMGSLTGAYSTAMMADRSVAL
jgi:hypothetical protein